MPTPVTIPQISNTWTPSNVPADAYLELGSATQPLGLGSARMLAQYARSYVRQVAWYGALGDNTTDDAAAIQAAIDDLPSSGGESVLEFEPYKTYWIGAGSPALTIDKRVIIRGNGARLRYTGTARAVEITEFNVTIENLSWFKAYSFSNPMSDLSGSALVIDSTQDFTIRRCHFAGFGYGIVAYGDTAGCSTGLLEGCRIDDCLRGMTFTSGASYCTSIDVIGCKITSGAFVNKTGGRNISIEKGAGALDGIRFFGGTSQTGTNAGVGLGMPKLLYCNAPNCVFLHVYWDVGSMSDEIEFTSAATNCVLDMGADLTTVSVLYPAGNPGKLILFRGSSTTGSGFIWPNLVDLSGAAAGQIKFPATPNLSTDPNTIDAHQEGLFTPTVVGATSAGSGTYVHQRGKYQRDSNKVHVSFSMEISAHTGTGQILIDGLPYVSASGSAPQSDLAMFFGNLVFTGQVFCNVVRGLGRASLWSSATGAGLVAIDIPTITPPANLTIEGSGSYYLS